MIRPMTAEDIAGAMRLKEAAGWNQTALDWQRLLRLEPGGCFVEERDGTVAGTTTALRHGTELAWIGMVLVLPEFRRRGIARGLMQHALEWLARKRSLLSGLDATSMGRPLYEQLGYRTDGVIERWARPPVGSVRAKAPPERALLDESVLALDRAAVGYDRARLLRDLACDETVDLVRGRSGFALGRPGSGAWFVGPCVARDEGEAGGLIRKLLAPHAGERVFWDILESSAPARSLAGRLGFRPVRRLARMLRAEGDPALPRPRPRLVYASAGFEFG